MDRPASAPPERTPRTGQVRSWSADPLRHAACWLWESVSAPSPCLEAPERRRRARMLTSLLLFLVTAAAVLMWLLPWLLAPQEHAANRDLGLTGIGVVSAGLLIYLVSRTRHYETAMWLAVFTTSVAVIASAYIAQGTIWLEGAPYFLAVAVILAAVLLPVTATLGVVAVTVAIPLVFHATIPSFDAAMLANSITFLAVTSSVILITAFMHHQDLIQIHAQAAEIKQSEERYRTLFDASFEGLVLHEGGRILDVNTALTRIWGTTRSALVGKPLDRLVVEDSQGHLLQSVASTHHTHREAVAHRGDGEPFPVEFITKPHLFKGRIIHATGFRDITVRKETEAAREKARDLQLANQRLQEIERMKAHILNVTSHELNTPITPIRMQVHLLKSRRYGELNERQNEAVMVLDRNLRRLTVLVKDILDVSRLHSGRLRIRPESVDLRAVVQDTVAAYAAIAAQHGVALRASEGPASWVHADPVRLHQVMTNLISNALKFTPSGGHVEVRVTADEGSPWVCVEVRDTGLGLDAMQRARLFRPFEQVHDASPAREAGSGLGLFISKEIAESHGGRLSVASAGPGLGCTFTLRMPRTPEGEAGTERPAARTAQGLGTPNGEVSCNGTREGEET